MVKRSLLPGQMRIKYADILLIAFLLSISVLGWLAGKQRARSGRYYLVTLQNEVAYRLPLEKDTLLSLSGKTGEISIQVQSGNVAVNSTTCPLRICRKTGEIHKPGEAIICVPNRMTITIEGGKRGTIDAITE